jgi:hypothetical protein
VAEIEGVLVGVAEGVSVGVGVNPVVTVGVGVAVLEGVGVKVHSNSTTTPLNISYLVTAEYKIFAGKIESR